MDDVKRLQTELGRAYRALHGFYAMCAKGKRPNDAMVDADVAKLQALLSGTDPMSPGAGVSQ